MKERRNPRNVGHRAGRDGVLGGLAALLLLSALVPGCSFKRMAAGGMADALTESSTVFSSDEDPELVRDAVPFGLKTMEALLEILPEHRGLLLATCQGFTQYAYAFVELDAELAGPGERRRAEHERERALKLFLRARGYGLRGLELRHKGVSEALMNDPAAAAATIDARDIDLLYWTAASWGAAISAGRDRPELIADIGAVRAMMERALELDESYDHGAVHEAMIAIESAAGSFGGSYARARQHFERAVELSGGERPGPYVTMAESVSVPEQKRGEFVELLQKALSIDPDLDHDSRLANILLQRKARALLARVDDLFLDSNESGSDVEGE